MSERILGRGAELQQIGALLADEAPTARALVLTGDAGVGRHKFGAAGSATIRMKLTAAGRKQLRHVKRLRLTAKGTFTPAPDPPVTATRRFTLRR
jgi:hypothetical protein